MTFLRGTLGLHANGSGAADDNIRAEVGCEKLADRWSKLRLGYWRRIFSSPATRLLRVVAAFRHGECMAPGQYGTRGWMPSARSTLQTAGLDHYWQEPPAAADCAGGQWREIAYTAVEETSDTDRHAHMSAGRGTSAYLPLKEWGSNTTEYAFSSGEEGRLGYRVPERYLDDRQDLKGTRLKLL